MVNSTTYVVNKEDKIELHIPNLNYFKPESSSNTNIKIHQIPTKIKTDREGYF